MIVSDSEIARQKAAEVIRSGGVMSFRTDTFYGLGADPCNSKAVRKIRELKGREEVKPILVLVSDVASVERFIASQSDLFKLVAGRFWPGPLTLIGRARRELPEELTAGTGTIGVRLPDDEALRELLRICGGALTATSANLSGSPAARTASEVASYFPVGVDLIVDGSEVTVIEPSTVLDLSGAGARLVREGALPKTKLSEVVSLLED